MAAHIITRIQVGDYDAWRPMFDQDRPQAREKATAQRVFRGVDDPNHVFVVRRARRRTTAPAPPRPAAAPPAGSGGSP
jgi:hypothetical protein